jgi:hypothetical protein
MHRRVSNSEYKYAIKTRARLIKDKSDHYITYYSFLDKNDKGKTLYCVSEELFQLAREEKNKAKTKHEIIEQLKNF